MLYCKHDLFHNLILINKSSSNFDTFPFLGRCVLLLRPRGRPGRPRRPSADDLHQGRDHRRGGVGPARHEIRQDLEGAKHGRGPVAGRCVHVRERGRPFSVVGAAIAAAVAFLSVEAVGVEAEVAASMHCCVTCSIGAFGSLNGWFSYFSWCCRYYLSSCCSYRYFCCCCCCCFCFCCCCCCCSYCCCSCRYCCCFFLIDIFCCCFNCCCQCSAPRALLKDVSLSFSGWFYVLLLLVTLMMLLLLELQLFVQNKSPPPRCRLHASAHPRPPADLPRRRPGGGGGLGRRGRGHPDAAEQGPRGVPPPGAAQGPLAAHAQSDKTRHLREQVDAQHRRGALLRGRDLVRRFPTC